VSTISKLFKSFIDALLPQRCIVCDRLSESGSYFCKNCTGKITPIHYKFCKKCGCDERACDCNRFIYHFDGMVAPFLNSGPAKESFYSYKFNSNLSAVDYFAENMALIFKENFGDIKIDMICYVPLSKKQLKERDFDKCELLSQRVSKLLNIPMEKAILKNENILTQHNLSIDTRFENVRNAYRIVKNVKGKKVLLIDDIKTTGATLDACTRELKFAGAKEVYCLTALSGEKY